MNAYNQDPFYIPEPIPGEGGGFTKELITAGAHHAVCCQLHNVGYQMFKNEVSLSPKAVIIFEVEQKMTGGKMAGEPMVISETFPMFMGENSKLRKMLEGWRGKPYSPEELKNFSIGGIVGRPCTLLIVHEKKKSDGTMRAKIAGVLPAQGPGWVPTYTEMPEWVAKEKAAQVPAPAPKQPYQGTPAPAAMPTQAPGPAVMSPSPAMAAKGPATHDAHGDRLPF
jgi:hypothetical protein